MSSCVHCTDFTLVVSYFFIGLNYEYTEEKQILILNLTNFDPNLIFDNHVLETVSSCMSPLAQINRVKYSFDKQSLIIM